jgi:hypothetical protein
MEEPSFQELWNHEREIFESRYGKDDVCDRPPLTTEELKNLGAVRCVTPQMWVEGVTLRGGGKVKLDVVGWVRDGYVVRDWK